MPKDVLRKDPERSVAEPPVYKRNFDVWLHFFTLCLSIGEHLCYIEHSGSRLNNDCEYDTSVVLPRNFW